MDVHKPGGHLSRYADSDESFVKSSSEHHQVVAS